MKVLKNNIKYDVMCRGRMFFSRAYSMAECFDRHGLALMEDKELPLAREL